MIEKCGTLMATLVCATLLCACGSSDGPAAQSSNGATAPMVGSSMTPAGASTAGNLGASAAEAGSAGTPGGAPAVGMPTPVAPPAGTAAPVAPPASSPAPVAPPVSGSAPAGGSEMMPGSGASGLPSDAPGAMAGDAPGDMLGMASDGGDSPTGDGATMPSSTSEGCPGLPDLSDFGAKGPFDVKMVPNTGPDGTYVVYRPDATLGMNGLKHPVATWGNGILTTPDQYQTLLGHFASHGFVVIACPSSQPEQPCLDNGMNWLIQQNEAEGPLKDKLDVTKEITLGYSWGGGAQIDTSVRPNVKASISFHGMPARNNPWGKMHAPLLLFTSTGDTFVSAEGYVLPNYNNSKVDTFFAQLQENVGHVYPCDPGSVCDIGGVALGGPAQGAVKEQAPAIAWVRHFACGDNSDAVRKYFYGPDAILCGASWECRRKPEATWE